MTTTIYFGTNRDGRPAAKPTRFGKRFSDDGLANLRFGKASVTGKRVSIAVHQESLERLGTTKLMDAERSKLGSSTLFSALRSEMRELRSDTIVFIHGYNVSFKEAVQAAARVHDNFSGLNSGAGVNVVLFSWPSDGSMAPWLAYSSDRRDAAASGPAFARGLLKLNDFFQKMAREDVCEQRIHLVAHSMGNYVLRHALQELRRQSRGGIPRLFDQIFLMAADEDDDAFELDHKLRLLPRLGRRVNVYFNRGDTAMAISDATKGNPDRLGDDGPRSPFQVPGKVTQIDCTYVVEGAIEHSYYLEPRVARDMAQAMEGLDPLDVEGRAFLDDRNRFLLQPEEEG